jgi:hypothetical protein
VDGSATGGPEQLVGGSVVDRDRQVVHKLGEV